jgi:cytochrome b
MSLEPTQNEKATRTPPAPAGQYLPILRLQHWQILNAILAAALIFFSGDQLIGLGVGGACIAVIALSGLRHAFRRTLFGEEGAALLNLALIWLPGLAMVGLAALGLNLYLTGNGDDLARFGGFAVFVLQILFFVAFGSVPQSHQRQQQSRSS